MAKGDVTYSAEFVVLLDKLKSGVIDTQTTLTKLENEFKEKGKNSGEGFAQGIKKGFDESGKEAAKLGANIAKSFSLVSMAVTAGIKAIKTISGAIKDAFMANENFRKSAEDLKSAMGASFAAAVRPVSDLFSTILQKVADSIKRTNDFNKALKNLKDTAKAYSGDLDGSFSQVQKDIESITSAIEVQQGIIEHYQNNTITGGIVPEAELEKLVYYQEKLNELKNIEARLGIEVKNANSENLKSEAEYRAQLEDINVMENAMSGTKEQTAQAQQQANRERQSANEAYLRQLIEIRSRMLSATDVDQTELDIIRQKIALQAELLKIQTEQNAPDTRQESTQGKVNDIVSARTELQKKMNDELAVAQREAERIEDIVKRENYLREEQNKIYSNTRGELDKIIVKYEATRENAKKTYEFADLLDKAVADTVDKTVDLSKMEKYLEERTAARAAYEEQIRTAEFERGQGLITENQLAEERNRAADEFNKKIAAAAGKYDDLAVSAVAANDVIKEGTKQQFDFKGLAAGISQGVGLYEQAASSIMSITGSMAETQIDIINDLLETQRELIDEQYEYTMAKLDEERQAALEAAGFAQSVTEEGLAASMEAAVASGDEGAIYREKRRQEELAINKKYDQLEEQAEKKKLADTKAAEEKAARETAEIQYRQAMTDWVLKLAIAPAQIASAILQGYADAGPIGGVILAGIMAGLGALQLGAIIAAEPKKPAFKHGGIVGLPETYDTRYANGGIVRSNTPRGIDAVDTTLANREMILNDDQQSNLFNMIKAGQIIANSGGGPYALNVYLSVAQTADMIIECVNNGQTRQIEGRMVRQ